MLCEYKHASHQFHLMVISHAAASMLSIKMLSIIIDIYGIIGTQVVDMHVCTVLYCSMKDDKIKDSDFACIREYFRTPKTYCKFQSQNIPSAAGLKETITAFKKGMKLSRDQAPKVERETRELRMSSLRFSTSRFCITSSLFGDALSRRQACIETY